MLTENANLQGTCMACIHIYCAQYVSCLNIANCIYTMCLCIEKIFIKCDLQFVLDANCFIKEMGNGMRKELVFCT